ncbi:FxSxx-COOH system tetratricopeptide repeat protein [Streptomyces halobius]|uniref:Tetratricopeptide repeat protein n=1 Tax=Streptomyces halobius TaxID=2879846 RepID=A0ABY4M7J0_9ACTN|nr:FxSxx-COOH system tetratricopeptide repeat protein [Streptomyces halobius]UQA92341.1 tetratricopeptide repeat protein [Streptomyces halobius]
MTPLFRKRRRERPARDQRHAQGPPTPVHADASGPRSIAIAAPGGFYGVAQTGDGARALMLPPQALLPPADVDAPPGLDNLPRRGAFVGRTAELDRLDKVLSHPGEVVVQAVHGLGGIGKSALAAHWAVTRAHAAGCAPIRWITADSAASVQRGLADLASALQPALAEVLRAADLTERALQWLATHGGWLLVLDNVNDPRDIAPLLDRARGGRFLITSRLATVWHDAATVVRLDVLDENASLALLTRIATAGADPRDMDGAAELCAELGHLPLAVEQAAAYLAQAPLLTPRGYLGLLARYPADLYGAGGVPGADSERTVARVWNLTLDRIRRTQPLATDLLRLLAWYAPDRIPVGLLGGVPGTPEATGALGLLTAYSMATADPATGTLAVHRLVQALARTPDPRDPHRTPDLVDRARRAAAAHLQAALPATSLDPATWPAWRALTPHIDALIDHSPPETDTSEDIGRVLNEAGLFLTHQGDTSRAITYYERALTAAARELGDTGPVTLTVRNNLARAYEFKGDAARALSLLEDTLRDRERVLGTDHPHTLSTRNNLAQAHQSAGNLARALPLFEQTLHDRIRTVGRDHPDTLIARNNLAFAYTAAGDPARALPLHREIAEDAVRILGEHHLHTLIMRNNLAGAYAAVGDLGRAVPLYERVLGDRERLLGADHPHTLATRGGLADAYEAAGDLKRAIPLYEQTLADRERVLGAGSPLTVVSGNDLAGALVAAGRPDRALPVYEQALRDAARNLGDTHELTRTVRHNLAATHARRGHLDLAVPLLEQTLDATVRSVGEDHPDTGAVRLDLAAAYAATGRPDLAIPLYERALTDAVRLLGAGHPTTTAIRAALTAVRRTSGQ